MTYHKYKKDFLTKVIFRIDFDQVKLSQLEDFSEKIKKDFPINKEGKGEEGMINFDFKTKELKQTSSSVVVWDFYNKDKTKKIKIHPNFLFVEYSKYKDSKELLKDIDIVSSFIKIFKIKTINRMGLRYINEIKLKNKDFLNWNKYIDNKLLGSLDFATSNKKAIARAMGQIVFKENFGDINFRYGLWNANYPNEINEKVFILDFDGYSKFPLDTDETNIIKLVEEYNQKIEDLFESVIKEDLSKILNKKK